MPIPVTLPHTLLTPTTKLINHVYGCGYSLESVPETMPKAMNDIVPTCYLVDPFVECGRSGVGITFDAICIPREGILRVILFNTLSRPQRRSNRGYTLWLVDVFHYRYGSSGTYAYVTSVSNTKSLSCSPTAHAKHISVSPMRATMWRSSSSC